MPLLLLVRHARAGTRGTGPSDLDRPLDAHGRRQAEALPGVLLPLFDTMTDDDDGPAIVSSPARRCIETVAPTAARLGTSVTIDEALIEGADVRPLHERLRTLVRPTMWSSHGDVIPELLSMLARRGLDLGPDPRCRKGSTWVLDIVSGTVRSARSLPPPA